ncbi:MAG: phosphoribosylglycinamide formyltransferase [Johnsonella sp.]|nr:phosphoribosylglycinamide formyltransferase [Johnsonella sp.]
MLRIAVMASGSGSNLQAVMDRIEDKSIKNAEIVLVFSNNPDAYALKRAEAAGIRTACISPRSYAKREEFEYAMLELLKSSSPDLIVLAGFLVNIPPEMVKEFCGRIINIHPSLIPSFCGKGYYGLRVHEAALHRGVKISGATVHYVDEGVDSGPIILQKAVEVRKGDTPLTLQKRIMEEAEWILLPQAIAMIAERKAGKQSKEDERGLS